MAFTRIEMSYTRYAKRNANVEGVNYEAVNEDRKSLGLEPLPYKTEYKK